MPDRLGALCVPTTTFLFLWLMNKIHFAVDARTQTNRFLTKNEPQNITFERVAEDNNRWVGCTNIHIENQNIVFASYNFSVPVLRNDIHFTVMAGTKNEQDFWSEMNHKISQIEGLQRTTPDESGELAFRQCIRILCLSPTTIVQEAK